MATTAEDRAIGVLCAKNLHQTLWLPETAEHPRLRVTYSTTTNFDNDSLPAVLFVAPMFGTRWESLHFDKIANDCGVRLICVDRPAFGGSTPVSIDIRVRTWLETFPALLKHLNVQHVALMTHSAGAIYTLNTLIHHRALLYPKAPFVAFIAPYVPFMHTGATLPTMAAKLPTNLLNSWAPLQNFIASQIIPSTAWSGGIISQSAEWLSSFAKTDDPGTKASTTTTPFEQYGYDKETANHIEKLALKYQCAESNTGANEEAKLCLRKCDDSAWLDAADYSGCIRRTATNEAAFNHQSEAVKLKVAGYFAGSDIMIAKRGQEFFEQCWQNDDVRDKVDFTTRTFPEANHDSVLVDQKKGSLREVFETIARLHKANTMI